MTHTHSHSPASVGTLTWNCWHDLHGYCAGNDCDCDCHTLPVTLADAIARVHATEYESDVRHVAVWVADDGGTCEWPMATVDNRRARVLARIARYSMPTPVVLAIIPVH